MTETTATRQSEKKFVPTVFWLANPQLGLKIKVPGTSRFLKFKNGKAVAKSQQEYDLIKATGMAFEQDDLKEPIKPHPQTGYAPQSMAAYQEHQNYIPQG